MVFNTAILPESPADKVLANKGEQLPLMEAFYTIQGEGFYQGNAAYFIRLAGCDVGCVWCDVKESWEESRYPYQSVNNIVSGAEAHPSRIAVVTGGEPLLHPLDQLCSVLRKKGFRAHIETSGTHPVSGTWDWICLSPKKFKAPLPAICPLANELKVIIFHPSDFDWAEQYAALVGPECHLFLQPEWDRRNKMIPLIIDYVKSHPQWGISLQAHKYLGIP